MKRGRKREEIKQGQKFGRFTVMREAEPTIIKREIRNIWVKCSCGNRAIVQLSNLKSKHSQSCGCIRKPYKLKRDFPKSTGG